MKASKDNSINIAQFAGSKSEVSVRHGALIAQGNTVISVGINSVAPPKKILKKFIGFNVGCTTHAECDAICNLLASICPDQTIRASLTKIRRHKYDILCRT